jgi:ribosome-associated heat shock protein Hsp15
MSVRLDVWLWSARFFKTRSLAADSIDAGRVEVNGQRAKRSRPVGVGDTVRVRKPPFEQVVEILGESEQRGPASVAATLYKETEESLEARAKLAAQFKAMGPPVFRDRGKPGKKERRAMDRWKGRDS